MAGLGVAPQWCGGSVVGEGAHELLDGEEARSQRRDAPVAGGGRNDHHDDAERQHDDEHVSTHSHVLCQ